MIGRWVLRLVPWWAFGLMALWLVPLALTTASDSWQRLREISLASAAQPPAEIRLAPQALLPGAGVALGEMQISGRLVALGRLSGEDGRIYALIGPAKASGGPSVALLWSANTPADDVRAALDRATGEGGLRTVRAFALDPAPHRAMLMQALAEQGAAVDGPLILARPWFGTRAEALRAETFAAATSALLLIAFALACGIAAVLRFRAWRRRRAAARPTPVSATARPVVTRNAGPAGKAAAPPARAADPYANSPIISARRGWLS